jgi:hypothetical protein
MPSLGKGTTRAVFSVGSIAFKLALHQHGAKCNLFEAKLYRDADARRKAMLCPVLWCSPSGAVLVARRAPTSRGVAGLERARGKGEMYPAGRPVTTVLEALEGALTPERLPNS